MAIDCHKEVHTDGTENFEEFYDLSIRQNMLSARVMPEDVANLAVFLASDDARHITAQTINVCAGSCPS